MSDGSGLTGESAAMDIYHNVKLVCRLCCYEGLTNDQL